MQETEVTSEPPSADNLNRKLQDYKQKYRHEKRRRQEEKLLHRQQQALSATQDKSESVRHLDMSSEPQSSSYLQVQLPSRQKRHSVVGLGSEVSDLGLRETALGAWGRRLEEQEARLAERQTQLEEFEKEVDEIEGYLDRRKEICDRKDEELKEFHEELETLQEELEGYKNNLLIMRDSTDNASERAKRNWDYVHASVLDKHSVLEVSLKNLKTELETANNSLARKDQQILDLQSQYAEQEEELLRRDQHIQRLQRQLSALDAPLVTVTAPDSARAHKLQRESSAPSSERSLRFADSVDGGEALADSYPPVYRRQLHGKPRNRPARSSDSAKFDYDVSESRTCNVM